MKYLLFYWWSINRIAFSCYFLYFTDYLSEFSGNNKHTVLLSNLSLCLNYAFNYGKITADYVTITFSL